MKKPRKHYFYVINKDYWECEYPIWKIIKWPGKNTWPRYRFDNYWLAYGFLQEITKEPRYTEDEASLAYDYKQFLARRCQRG